MEKAVVGNLKCAWPARRNMFRVSSWAPGFLAPCLLTLSVLSCRSFLLPIPVEPSPHPILLPQMWLGLFRETVSVFFGYTSAGWMQFVVSSVCVLMVTCSCCQGLKWYSSYSCVGVGNHWKILLNFFFLHLSMYFNRGMDAIMEV